MLTMMMRWDEMKGIILTVRSIAIGFHMSYHHHTIIPLLVTHKPPHVSSHLCTVCFDRSDLTLSRLTGHKCAMRLP